MPNALFACAVSFTCIEYLVAVSFLFVQTRQGHMQYSAVLNKQKLTARSLYRKQIVYLAFGVLQNTPAVLILCQGLPFSPRNRSVLALHERASVGEERELNDDVS